MTRFFRLSFAGCTLWLVMSCSAPAADTIEARQQVFLDNLAKQQLPQGSIYTWVDEGRWSVAQACLVKNVRLDEANRYFSEVGFSSLSRGLVYDTDVQVTDLVRTYLQFRDDNRLNAAAKAHLKEMLAGWEVPNRDRNRNADTHYEWPHEYTENHSLNILAASYLIDYALARDRAQHKDLIERFLADRAKWGWSEFNSTRYGLVTIKVLLLLHDFSPDESVRTAARMLLDLQTIDYATHCLGYWRGMPSSRGASNQGNNSQNAFLALARLWIGDPNPNAAYADTGFIAHGLTSKYRPPEAAIQLQKNQAQRGRYVATQVATSGPQKLRVPIVIWVTPAVTMASAQGFGSYYDGSYASISFASSPGNVVTASNGQGRNILQHRNVMATFGRVDWHGQLTKESKGNVTLGTDGQAFVGQIDLAEDCHVLMVGDRGEFADLNAFGKAFAALAPTFEGGTVRWTMPGGERVEMVNEMHGGQWKLAAASVGGSPLRIDRNMLFDSPYMRSVRGSRLVEVRHQGKKWVYDFRDNQKPQIAAVRDDGFTQIPPDVQPGPLGMQLVHVPAGEFPQGSPAAEGRSNEGPQRWVHVDGFLISQTEITVGQYKEYVKARPQSAPPDWYYSEWGKTDRHAMTWVKWDDAMGFCRWLSESTGHVYRLPTEAEWEKAAKGFAHSPYPWGEDYDGTQSGSANETYLEVGSKPQDVSPFGVLDMAGNVWEWCGDWYDASAYQSPQSRNPAGPASGDTRVVRSTGWNYDPDTFRITYRTSFDPAKQSVHIGFRVVRELPSSK